MNYLFFDFESQYYLSGFPSSDAFALETPDGVAQFLDMRYYSEASDRQKKGELKDNVTLYRLDCGVFKALKEYVSAKNIKKLYVDCKLVSLYMYEKLKAELPDIEIEYRSDILTERRMIKTSFEKEMIKKAQSVTDLAFETVLKKIRRGVTENEIAAEIEYVFKMNGCDKAFDTIAVSGKKSAYPHGVPSDVVISENAFLTMDFGAKYRGYCSDMTRTVVLGKAGEEMKKVYYTVLEAQKRGIDAVRNGVKGSDVDKAARDVIEKAGYGKYFTHSTGHSLGLEIHEMPRSSSKSEDVLKTDEFMTVEPGIYIEGFGGVRIEDTVCVTENGCDDYAKSPKELIEL
ncbi:MAG: aminopeptidase P family protein [Clostridia bacterium]|nr:aminopeptidase P family protein [Clostridia bacterium]